MTWTTASYAAADVTNDVSVTPANAQHVRWRKRVDEYDAADGEVSFYDE